MALCPNTSHPDFIRLKDKFGETAAHYVWTRLNGNEQVISDYLASKLSSDDVNENKYHTHKSLKKFLLGKTGVNYTEANRKIVFDNIKKGIETHRIGSKSRQYWH